MAPGALAGPEKGARQEGRTIIWVDESALYLLPSVVRTSAPRGQTLVLHSKLTRDHYSVIGALAETGQVVTEMQRQAFDGHGIVRFLKHLLRRVPGKLLVIWDGLPAHRGEAVRSFLAQGAAARRQLERLPGYAPELNPVDGLWHYLKNVELRNVCFPGFGWLADGITRALGRVRHKRTVLQGFIRQAGYDL